MTCVDFMKQSVDKLSETLGQINQTGFWIAGCLVVCSIALEPGECSVQHLQDRTCGEGSSEFCRTEVEMMPRVSATVQTMET